MSHDVSIIEDVGSTWPCVHVNIDPPTREAAALCDAALERGVKGLRGLGTAKASVALSSALVGGLDSKAEGYAEAVTFLKECISACDTHTAGEFFVDS